MKQDIELFAKDSPARFVLENRGDDQVPKVSIVSPGQPLVNPTINGHPVFKRMLSGSMISLSPAGKGFYTYTDNFLRYYKWRKQNTDARGIENLQAARISPPGPKVLERRETT
ncbi:hypothetical protein ACFLQR_00510 [Verrucomicrobiota bacterium]